MSIKHFIQSEVLVPRLSGSGRTGVLVVYDPEKRLRDLCLKLASQKRRVVDATESSIESREEAMEALQQMGQRSVEELVVYVPAKRPATDEERQADPFAVYSVCGEVFPQGDGDEYQNLCLRAKPDHATEIRRIFAENPAPPFAVIDAVGGGSGWPTLQAALGVESGREILFALLAPTDEQSANLKSDDAWVAEAKTLFESALGLKLITRGKTWNSIADELWRFLLLSEFAFDLPADLPPTLAGIPRAQPEAVPLINDLCDNLRGYQRTQSIYIERAEVIEHDLNLVSACGGIEDLGVRDTFPFEERSFFAQAADALRRDNLDRLREITAHHEESVWAGRGENQAQWGLLKTAWQLIECGDDVQRQLPDYESSMETLVGYYTSSAREVDRLHREFELAAGDVVLGDEVADSIVAQGRKAYRACSSRLQATFMRYLERDGWPIDRQLSNTQVFSKFVATRLQESGRRVAMLLIDALRYELGVELCKQLADEGTVEVQAACAALPTVTPIGMASLLPGADTDLGINKLDGKAVPFIGETRLKDVTQRIAVLKSHYGQRFAEMPLREFNKKKAVDSAVDFLVLRSNEIDEQLESSADPATALRQIQWNLKDIRVAVHRLRDQGFADVVIATDHGFILSVEQAAGDTCEKPPGNWINLHDRALLGDGSGHNSVAVLSALHVGIRGDFAQVAFPRALVPYKAGLGYFHGGASLQESIVPVITLKLPEPEREAEQRPSVELIYKRGAKKITTRLPVVEVTVSATELFAIETPVEIRIEAQDKKGSVIGEAKPGGDVNPATGTLTIRPNSGVKIPIRMDEDFRGKFSLKALDPATLMVLASLDLETDYLE